MELELLNLLDSILGLHQRHANNEYYWHCPFCNHKNKKLAINITNRKWHCWVCNISGKTLLSLFKRLDCSVHQKKTLSVILKDELPYVKLENTQNIKLQLPLDVKPLSITNNTIAYKHAMAYIKNRNITDMDIERYQLYYSDSGMYENRIIIPSFDKELSLNYFVGRSFYENTMKYKNPPVSKNIIAFEHLINYSLPIVLCEGVFDAMAIRHNAIPLLGKQIGKTLFNKLLNSKIPSVYIALDKDALKSAVYYSELLLNNNKQVYLVELNKKDPSELGFTEMQKLIYSAKPLTFTDLIRHKVNL